MQLKLAVKRVMLVVELEDGRSFIVKKDDRRMRVWMQAAPKVKKPKAR